MRRRKKETNYMRLVEVKFSFLPRKRSLSLSIANGYPSIYVQVSVGQNYSQITLRLFF